MDLGGVAGCGWLPRRARWTYFGEGHPPGEISRWRGCEHADRHGYVGIRGRAIVRPRTPRTEPAIIRHLLYLFVRKGITPALAGALDGRNREGNMPLTASIDLFWRFKGTMAPHLSFRAAGPISVTSMASSADLGRPTRARSGRWCHLGLAGGTLR
jgi:hypothetical protein